jgi:hypothetical protein
MVMGIGR